MIQKFILINGKGEEYDLLSVAKSPTFQIEGFGYTDETEFLGIGNNFVPLEEREEQRSIEFTALFWQSVDAFYKQFTDHARHNPLTLLYENDNGVYYIPCRLGNVAKTEKVGIDIKGVSVGFKLTGKPYKVETSECQAAETGGGKIYPYTYPYTYSSDLVNTLSIKSDSYLDSPCILTIYGQAVNPVWRHYSNGILVETGAYSGTIPEGHYLVVDAKSVPYSIIEYDSAGRIVADRYALCDFSTERFMHANEGRNRYVVSHDGVNNLQLKMEAHIQYETV